LSIKNSLSLQGSGRTVKEAKQFMEEFLAMRGMMKKMSTMAANQGKGDDPTQVLLLLYYSQA